MIVNQAAKTADERFEWGVMAALEATRAAFVPTRAQRGYLRRALTQPGGKLPLFDPDGQTVDPRVVRSCLAKGWAAPWFQYPQEPDWLVCRITDRGRQAVAPR